MAAIPWLAMVRLFTEDRVVLLNTDRLISPIPLVKKITEVKSGG